MRAKYIWATLHLEVSDVELVEQHQLLESLAAELSDAAVKWARDVRDRTMHATVECKAGDVSLFTIKLHARPVRK